jgi:hypothetical protein
VLKYSNSFKLLCARFSQVLLLKRVGYVKPLRLVVRKRVGYVRPLRLSLRGCENKS